MRQTMRLLLTLFVFLFSLVANAQDSKQNLLRAAREQVKSDLQRHLDLLRPPVGLDRSSYHFLNSQGLFPLEDGHTSKVQYLDQSGFPVVYAPHNLNAAKTTGADQLQPGGSLGLNLTGKGFTVGIFDQTRPKPDHVEFQSRLTQVDGSTEELSTHATHVTGTILAAGINPQAKGMAYESTGWSFNWESDISKMNANAYDPETKSNGMLISNHSYGVVLGWRNTESGWEWVGNPSVDENKDYRFGFYSTKSQSIDELLFTKPYYSVVWSAGNDRNDTGDGTRDPDGPEDTIGPEGVAKNNITIGAVEKVIDYTQASDVKMSTFSAWGPTDDGRIKPDLVAMGVGVFSSSITSTGADGYASQSGTSMAAPNATGSLFLLQQLYAERNSGRFMLSSALKALAIQTAKEAGPAAGPDYMYGWGLLDVAAAAKIILNEDGSSSFIREEILGNDEVQEFEFVSDGVTPIKATIAWTDPAGTPTAASLNPTDLMLVNDLDLRIFDEDGKEYFPWTLNPAQLAGARGDRTKDNFRDNVEQVWIPSPSAKKYTIQVSHKGDLKFDVQQYSIVFTAGVLDGADETLYWIGGESGSWNSAANWSLTSGGSSAGKVPGESTRVVFDGDGSPEISFSANASAFSVNLFGDQTVALNLNGKDIKVYNGFRVNNQVTQISNGRIIFENSGSNSQLVELGQTTFDEVRLLFNSGEWKLISADVLGDVLVDNAVLDIELSDVKSQSFTLNSNATLIGNFESLAFMTDFNSKSGAELKDDFELIFDGETGDFSNSSDSEINALSISSGTLSVLTDGFKNLKIEQARMNLGVAAISVNSLSLGVGATLNLGSTGKITVNQEITSSATSSNGSQIIAGSKGTVIHDIYRKYCFENLNISNVDLQGDAIVNLGTGATITNSSGWLSQECDAVLFANFDVSYTCVGAAVDFENLSEGEITSYSWDFAGLGSSTLENPFFVFGSPGTYNVELTVINQSGSTSYTQEVVVADNSLTQPIIVANGTTLTSQQPGDSYQWYLNGEKIAGATTRSFSATNDGSYQVAIFSEACNRVSEPVVISAIPDQEVELSRFGIFVGPIPSDDQINITVNNEYLGPIEFSIIDLSGKVMSLTEVGKNSERLDLKMSLPINRGLYILRIKTNNLTLHKKVLKQ
ncbi:putative secreted protein (Por secretion system target) [Algoriphagus zhangzhouensis]|uniref:Por secretion system C-terminal sorting domain-containing protein n=2 Tax=Algoriphagus zhangzhouensis TaxID=1073327 RepID=A0A1M7ZE21_9BACT|nr:putative secreted protein (Por secretion system target) [Algoriphagus zhangzhouensis]SHO63128.1 Por secretion system C-terminal sorting domain-containing protein [Algoriphagus zhangzhouensis]